MLIVLQRHQQRHIRFDERALQKRLHQAVQKDFLLLVKKKQESRFEKQRQFNVSLHNTHCDF